MTWQQAMNRSYDLNEGMTKGALDRLIQPLISIDEYESKISDRRAIVVGFYVDDADPANDLSNFVDRGSHPVLDTEVSPSPTPDGYFMVFVEIKRDDEFPTILMEILKDVKNINDVRDWSFTCPLHDGPIELNKDNLKDNLTLDPEQIINPPDAPDDTTDEIPGKIEESIGFWLNSMAESVMFEDGGIVLRKGAHAYHISVINDEDDEVINLSENNGSKILQHVLGPGYVVWDMGSHLMVEHQGTSLKIQMTS